ncbi:MAG: hypothetical protein ABEJ95_03980 [Candidatus Nanohalobium sp.]
MNSRKGLSQILWLIIAGAVLMMTGLSLIVLSQGGITSTSNQANTAACTNAVNTKCQLTGANSINPPATCMKDGKLIPEVKSKYGSGEGKISCPSSD